MNLFYRRPHHKTNSVFPEPTRGIPEPTRGRRVALINREVDVESQRSHIIVYIGAHGKDTDRNLKLALDFLDIKKDEKDEKDYLEKRLAKCLFFSSTGRGLINVDCPTGVNYNDPDRKNISPGTIKS